ncbi:hypothetical protein ACFVTE_16920 [Arthrobacter sp. NPDC058097]|uniref:hypothetical protein n=1 Tax=Arthrobacter sp. NPDC058097 TaxID=3346340 RepID=UPI0036DCBE2F
MNEAKGPRRLQPRMTRGGFRFLFVAWTATALFQLVVLILFWVAGKPWELASYLWLATILVALGGLAFLLYVRRNDRPFWDEEEARRAEWDRRGRAL